jgi:hypothetical protein
MSVFKGVEVERIEEGGVGVESWKMNEVRKVIW